MRTTPEELALTAQGGDASAAEALWVQVQRFACMIALRYLPMAKGNGGVSVEDLCQCAALGVLEAIRGYQADKGAFLTWCAFFIRRQCLSALGLTGRPRLEHYRKSSLDEPVPDTQDLTLMDCIEDDAAAASFDAVEERCWRETLRRDITEALDRLAGQEGYIIRRHDLEGAGMSAIGAELGLEVPRVQQRRKTAMAHLRKDRVLRRLYQPNYWRHKGVAAFNTTFSSVVEDEVIRHLDNERRDETP